MLLEEGLILRKNAKEKEACILSGASQTEQCAYREDGKSESLSRAGAALCPVAAPAPTASGNADAFRRRTGPRGVSFLAACRSPRCRGMAARGSEAASLHLF